MAASGQPTLALMPATGPTEHSEESSAGGVRETQQQKGKGGQPTARKKKQKKKKRTGPRGGRRGGVRHKWVTKTSAHEKWPTIWLDVHGHCLDLLKKSVPQGLQGYAADAAAPEDELGPDSRVDHIRSWENFEMNERANHGTALPYWESDYKFHEHLLPWSVEHSLQPPRNWTERAGWHVGYEYNEGGDVTNDGKNWESTRWQPTGPRRPAPKPPVRPVLRQRKPRSAREPEVMMATTAPSPLRATAPAFVPVAERDPSAPAAGGEETEFGQELKEEKTEAPDAPPESERPTDTRANTRAKRETSTNFLQIPMVSMLQQQQHKLDVSLIAKRTGQIRTPGYEDYFDSGGDDDATDFDSLGEPEDWGADGEDGVAGDSGGGWERRGSRLARCT